MIINNILSKVIFIYYIDIIIKLLAVTIQSEISADDPAEFSDSYQETSCQRNCLILRTRHAQYFLLVHFNFNLKSCTETFKL